MAWTDNLYSQLVGGLKIILPLAALALLSTLFLLARGSNTLETIPYAELAEMARQPSISNPNLAGVTPDGSSISITAVELRPDPDMPDAFSIIAPRLVLDAVDGSRVEITGGQGEINGLAKVLRMTGLVRLSASSGYVMETAGINANLATGVITSLGPLEVQAPFGILNAGAVVVSTSQTGLGQQMVFNGGVRLLYQPQP